jgi:hypothetical protein
MFNVKEAKMKNTKRTTLYAKRYTLYAILVILFCTILPQAKALAATYYCDPVNGNTVTGDGSSSNPWGTLMSVAKAGKFNGTIIKSGDTVKLRTGFHGNFGDSFGYSMTISNSDYITVEADTGAVPDVSFIVMKGGGSTHAKYWHFKGLRISPSFSETISKELKDRWYPDTYDYMISIQGGTYITFEDCDIFTTSDVSAWKVHITGTVNPDVTGNYDISGRYGSKVCCKREDGAYYIWRNSTGTQWHISTALGTDGAAYWIATVVAPLTFTEGTFIAQGTASGTPVVTEDWSDLAFSGIWAVLGSNWILHGNHIRNIASGPRGVRGLIEQNLIDGFCVDGLTAEGTGTIIQDNIITNVYEDGSSGTHSDAIHVSGDNIIIRRNYICAKTDPNRTSLLGENGINQNSAVPLTNSIIENNVVMAMTSAGLSFGDYSNNVKVLNNTVVPPYNTLSEQWPVIICGTHSTNIIFRNNIAKTFPSSVPSRNVVSNYNFKSTDYNLLNEFVDYVHGNVHLAANSNFINAGSSLDAPDEDLDRNSRPQGQGYDVGAYEYGASTFLYGDVNSDGEISAYDAALAAHIAVDLEHPDIKNPQAAEVSGDGQVTAYDAALIAQRAVGLIEKFPVE